jgi:transcriptional regulator with XRE-family HTH domain
MPWTVYHFGETVNGMKYEDAIVAFGTHVKELRVERGFSQEAFAQHCGIDRSYYGKIERCEANLTLKNIVAIAAALEISVQDLFENFPRPRRKNKSKEFK